MSNCFYSGNPTDLEDVLSRSSRLSAYYLSLPQSVQHVLEEHAGVIQSEDALRCYAEKLMETR